MIKKHLLNKKTKIKINQKKMIYWKKYPQTIDLKWILAKEYLESRKSPTRKKAEFLLKCISLSWVIWFFIIMIFWSIHKADASDNIRNEIRLERLEVCQEAIENSDIQERIMYKQILAVRCATYMWLVYAYESDFGKSRKCVEDKNCWGIKWNWYDTPAGFLKFGTYKEGRRYFAKKYFQWHYKKKINTFVNNWSMTDRATYKSFMWDRYSTMYKELEYLYFVN